MDAASTKQESSGATKASPSLSRGHADTFSSDSDATARSRHAESSSLPAIDGYEVLAKIGEGGMGTVWRARHHATQRLVALKLMKGAAIGSERARYRFEREVELAAKLDHPHIAGIYDAGLRSDLCYYAMELIDGLPLDQHVLQRDQSGEQLVELMAQICEAVQHAHQRGVIHRDLKPANILITRDGQPHVLDFGLAKALADDRPQITITLEGDAAGTPAFMAPEQAAGHVAELDTRTDVYGLGVILYRLLTGEHPYDLSGTRFDVMERIKTSQIIRPRHLSSHVNAELEAILLKALALKPADRYQSAGEFGDDLRRYLRREPVMARRASFWYFLRKRVRRHRVPLAVTAIVLTLLTSMAITAYLNVVAARDESDARLADSLVAQADLLMRTERWPDAKNRLHEAHRIIDRLGLDPRRADLALFQAGIRSPSPLISFSYGEHQPTCMVPMTDGRHLITGSAKEAIVWDLATGRRIAAWKGHDHPISAMALSPDGNWLLTGSEGGEIFLWDTRTQSLAHRFTPAPAAVGSIIYRPDKDEAIVGDNDGKLHRLDMVSQTVIASHQALSAPIDLLVCLKDGDTVLLGTTGTLIRWSIKDAQMGKHRGDDLHGKPFGATRRELDWGIFTGNRTNGFRAWNLDPVSSLPIHFGFHNGFVNDLALSGNGSFAASASEDGDVRVWRASNSNLLHILPDHHNPTRLVCFAHDHPIVISVGDDGMIRVWPVMEVEHHQTFNPIHMHASSMSADGKLILVLQSDEEPIELWDVASGQPIRAFPVRSNSVRSIALSPDGTMALADSDDGLTHVWDTATGEELSAFEERTHEHRCLSFNRDGSLLAIGNDDLFVRIYRVSDRRLIATTAQHDDGLYAIKLSPDGQWLATSASGSSEREQDVQLWNARTGVMHGRLPGHQGPCKAMAFSDDSKWLATGGDDTTVRLWNVQSGTHERTFTGQTEGITALTFTSDNRCLISGDWNSRVRIWELDGFTLLREIVHRGWTQGVHTSQDMSQLIVAGQGTITRWRVQGNDRRIEEERAVTEAARTLGEQPAHGPSLNTLGAWCASRGAWHWAVELFAEARDQGTEIDHAVLLTAAWRTEQYSTALEALDDAERKGLVSATYAKICRVRLLNDAGR